MQYEERNTTSSSDREGRLPVKKYLGAMGEAQTANDNERVDPAEHCGMPIFERVRKGSSEGDCHC